MSRHAADEPAGEPVTELDAGAEFRDDVEIESTPPLLVVVDVDDRPLPPADDVDDQVVVGLTARLPVGTYQTTPVLLIAGERVAAGLNGDGSLPSTPLVVDGFSTSWGRRELLAQPELSRGVFELFDPSKTWALDRDLIGVPIELTREPIAVNSSSPFQGRIQTVELVEKSVQLRDGSVVDGMLVTLTCTSILSDLANRRPTGTFPAETMTARRNRLLTFLPAGFASGIALRDAWQNVTVAPDTNPAGKSLLDHILALYDSCGADRATFLTGGGSTTLAKFIPRRFYSASRGLAQLFWDNQTTTDRNGKGAYARAMSVLPPGAEGAPGVPLFLDSQQLEADPSAGMSRGMESLLTRVSVNYKDAAASYAAGTATALVAGVDESVIGVREAVVDSILTTPTNAASAASELADFAANEGAEWSLPELHWATRRTSGFETSSQATYVLNGEEGTSIVFLQRSKLPALGIRPIVALIGGGIGYRRGGWELDLVIAPVATKLPQHAITWEEIDDGSADFEVQWWDGDNPRGMHETLTYEDLGHVATGINVSTIPPNQGFDS